MQSTPRWPLVVLGSVGLAALLGCAGLPLSFGQGWNNVTACQAYVDSYNQLTCVADHDALSRTDNCPADLNRSRCNLTEHYACLRLNTQCVDGRLDVSGVISCGDRSCN